MNKEMSDTLTLKWGTLKAWDFTNNKEGAKLLHEYAEYGMAFGAAQQRDTKEQKDIICKLIDVCNGDIWNDWTGEKMSKKEAREYVLGYRQEA